MDLSGYTVLDLTWLLPGPYASMLLADLGADVIKVEEPSRGDYARWWDPAVDPDGYGAMFHAVNRNKKSAVLDLKTEGGREAFLALAAEADVVFEQFRPGVVDRLGIDYEAVASVNEDVVYCSLSGYGQDGPYRNRVGHNSNYLGLAGMLEATKSRDGTVPALSPFPVADMVGGLFSAFAIATALLGREPGTGGEYLDVSMADAVLSLATGQQWRSTMADRLDPVERLMDRRDAPYRGVYETKDGNYVTIVAREKKFWNQFLDEIGRPDLAEYHLARGEDGEYAVEELQREFEKRTREEWEELLSDEIPFAPVNAFDEVESDPHFRTRGLFKEMELDGENSFTHIGFPIKSSAGVDDMRSPAPGFGEHTVEVLKRVLSPKRIDELVADGCVGTDT